MTSVARSNSDGGIRRPRACAAFMLIVRSSRTGCSTGRSCQTHTLALRQADQAHTDFAAIESDLEVIQKQLSRLPTRRELSGTALGISFATMMLTATFKRREGKPGYPISSRQEV